MTYSNRHSLRSSGLALPLTVGYCGLVFYASLYPFIGWQSKGVMPWAFVTAPLPRYWTGFDVAINVLGYMPLGFLVSILLMERTTKKMSHRALWFATFFACLVSFCMEALQTYLPPRVASNVDWILNTLGAALGAMFAWMADGLGILSSWSRWREHKFVSDSGVALGLLLLWPIALLYPTSVPLGLGHALGQWLDIDNQELSDKLFFMVLALGLLVPTLIAYAVTPRVTHRVLALMLIVLAALGITTLSNGLSFGSEHATIWLHTQSLWGLWLGAGAGVILLLTPSRLCWVLAFLILVPQLTLVNVMAQDPYFPQTLMIWEHGQFMRFYGATQWLGCLWPYAVLVLLIARIMQRDKT